MWSREEDRGGRRTEPSRAPSRSRPRDGGDAIIRTALEHCSRLDILIHNAGNVRRGSLKEMSHEDFDAVLDVHLRGAFNQRGLRSRFSSCALAGYGRRSC